MTYIPGVVIISGSNTATVEDGQLYSRITQNVIAEPLNSSTTNLSGSGIFGATFTGSAASTLGVVGIQVSMIADKNCLVQIQQSPDGVNWDIRDHYDFWYAEYALSDAKEGGFGITVQAVNSYFRVLVTNISTTPTTYFRLQSVLCPTVEALPRSLDDDQHLKVGIKSISDSYGFESENTPTGELRIAEVSRLVGANFEGNTIDPNFWTSSLANGGFVSQSNSQVVMSTGTSSSGSVKFASNRRARYVSGNAMRFRTVVQFPDTGSVGNIRRGGIAFGATMPTITDGAYFELSGSIFSVVTLKNGVETKVSSGQFNGRYGASWTPATSSGIYEIYWTTLNVYFIEDENIIHKIEATSATWSNTMNYYIYFSNINAGSTTDSILRVGDAGIARLGPLSTEAKGAYIGTATTTVLKYGPGKLHHILNNDNAGSCVIYDNITGGGTIIASVDAAKVLGNWDFDIPFSIGLTIVTTGAIKLTVAYE